MKSFARVRTRSAPLLLGLLLGVAGAGCRSHDPRLYDAVGQPLRETEPASYRIAVAPCEVTPAGTSPSAASPAWAQVTEGEFQEELVLALGELRAASEVFPVATPSSFEAYTEKADLMLRPRLEQAVFSYDGASSRAFVSSLLWMTTWIASLWVEDASYRARMVLRCDLVDPHTGVNVADGLEVRSDAVDLTFWDRNRAFSKGFWQSLIVPPFLTSDDEDVTGKTLKRRATELLAAQLKTFLKERLPKLERETLADIQLKTPRNGSAVGATTPLRCDVIARRLITEVVVLVNGEEVRRWDENELPSAGEQDQGDHFLFAMHIEDLKLPEPGRNMVRVLANVSGQWASRSVLLYHGEARRTEDAPAAGGKDEVKG